MNNNVLDMVSPAPNLLRWEVKGLLRKVPMVIEANNNLEFESALRAEPDC